MRGVLTRFLNQEVLLVHPFVYWALAIAWGLMLLAALSSIRNQEISGSGKWAWFLVVLFLPILGLALYAIWCLFRNDWNFLKPLLQTRSAAVRAVNQGLPRKQTRLP